MTETAREIVNDAEQDNRNVCLEIQMGRWRGR